MKDSLSKKNKEESSSQNFYFEYGKKHLVEMSLDTKGEISISVDGERVFKLIDKGFSDRLEN